MTTGMTAVAIAAAMLLVAMGSAGAQTPRPMPVMPPVSAAPPAPPPSGSAPSPILTGPGSISLGPQPSYPAPTYPGPLTQQQLQAYRTNLLDQRLRMERAGVSPASPRYRDIQRQLQRLGQ